MFNVFKLIIYMDENQVIQVGYKIVKIQYQIVRLLNPKTLNLSYYSIIKKLNNRATQVGHITNFPSNDLKFT